LAAIPKLEGDNKDMKEDNIHVYIEEDNIDMEEILTYRKRQYRCVKRPETTDTENSSDSSESIPSLASAIVQLANINERVNRLLPAIPKLDGDNIDLEENNVEMEEENIHTYRKRPYLCVNRSETTDTEQRSESSESAPPTRRLNINERVARLLGAVHKFECDNIDMEEDKVDMEEDNIDMEEDNIPTCSKRPKYSRDSSEYSSDSSQHSSDSSQHSSDSSQHSSDSSQYSSNSSEYSNNSSKYSDDSSECSNNSKYSSNSSEYGSDSLVYSGDSSEPIPFIGNINERIARLLATVPTLEGDNTEMEEDNSLTNRKRNYQSVKRQETTGTDHRSKHSASIPARRQY
jgi:hypothetical protein